MKTITWIFLYITLAVSPLQAYEDTVDLSDVGQVALKNSGAKAAQQDFLHGLAQLHNFEYEFAALDFIAAQKKDPYFALAYWGEAMTYNHGIWQRQNKEKALAALARYAPDPADRQAKAPTGLEKDLLAAVDILYGAGTKEKNDDRYRAKMARLHEKYPDNVDIAAFYALSIMASAHEGRDTALYMQSAAIMENFIHKFPDHPGVAHYLIHSTDDPTHAPLGLRAALTYAEIAPNAGHAQHMTSHIFLALGRWDDVISANIRAHGLSVAARAKLGEMDPACGHYSSWLMYAYLQVENRDKARDLMENCVAIVGGKGQNNASTHRYYSWMRTLYLYDTGEWTGEIASLPVNSSVNKRADYTNSYTDAIVALNRGDLPAARLAQKQAQKKLEGLNRYWDAQGLGQNKPARSKPLVEMKQLDALLLWSEGNREASLDKLRAAAILEESLPFGFGPPNPAKPAFELLGEKLLEAGRITEAQDVLEKAARRTRGKRLTLIALNAAKEAVDSPAKGDSKGSE